MVSTETPIYWIFKSQGREFHYPKAVWSFDGANGSTAGTVQFQFAQATSNGTNTTVSKNAQLIVWRVS